VIRFAVYPSDMVPSCWGGCTAFGGVTASMGILGTAFGGFVLDYLRRPYAKDIEKSLDTAMKLIIILSLVVCGLSLLHTDMLWSVLLRNSCAQYVLLACSVAGPPIRLLRIHVSEVR